MGFLDTLGNVFSGQSGATLGGLGRGLLAGSTNPNYTPGFAEAMSHGFQGAEQGRTGYLQEERYRQEMEAEKQRMERARARAKVIQEYLGGASASNPSPAAQGLYQQAATGGLRESILSSLSGGGAQATALPASNPLTVEPAADPNLDAAANRWRSVRDGLMQLAEHTESRGRQFDDNGQPLTSPAGAIGVLQIMPDTAPEAAADAGLPWDPERYRNDIEYNRALGRGYMDKLGRMYDGDPVLASTAYNWGMGRVNEHIKRVGDPRDGTISHEEWIESIPVEEARNYARNVGYKAMTQAGPQQVARGPVSAPQAAQAVLGPQGAPAQPQQAPGQPQARGIDAILGNTPQGELLRKLLPVMDPDKAMTLLSDLAVDQMGGREMTAAQRNAMFAANGDEALARSYMASEYQDSPSAKEAEVKALMDADPNLDLATATNIAYGRLQVSRDPVSGQAQMVDAATGQVIGKMSEEEARKLEDAAANVALFPPDLDLALGTGVDGWFYNALTQFQDTLGLPISERGEDVLRAKNALDNLAIQTEQALASGSDGRQSVYELQRFRELGVEGGKLLQGDQRARETARNTLQLVRGERAKAESILANPSGYTPTTVSKARVARTQFNALQNQYEALLKSYERTTPDSRQRAAQSDNELVAPPVRLEGASDAELDAAYEALPAGALYIGPDGVQRRK